MIQTPTRNPQTLGQGSGPPIFYIRHQSLPLRQTMGAIMASIEKRIARDGAVSYRVKVRLKGKPSQSASFERLTDAKKWAASTESAIREGRHFTKAEAKRIPWPT